MEGHKAFLTSGHCMGCVSWSVYDLYLLVFGGHSLGDNMGSF